MVTAKMTPHNTRPSPCRVLLRRRERQPALNAIALDHAVNEIRRDAMQAFDLPAGPLDFHLINGGRRTQPEVQAKVVLRKVTSSTADFTELNQLPSSYRHPGTNSSPVALGAR